MHAHLDACPCILPIAELVAPRVVAEEMGESRLSRIAIDVLGEDDEEDEHGGGNLRASRVYRVEDEVRA